MSRPTLKTRDDVTLAGRRWLSGSPRGAVVLVHGFTASSDDPRVVATAEALHARDVDVVSYDARGHGESGGASTLGDLERHDVAAAVDLARTRCDRVVLVGASMGAIAVLRHASDDPAVSGVVAVSCPARWRLPRSPQGVLAAGITRTGAGRFLMRHLLGVRVHSGWNDPDPPAEVVTRIRVPAAFVHGDTDRFIPAADAHELHGEANEPRWLSIVPGMGHAFVEPAVPAIVAAVEWVLDHSEVSR